jgi:hypothetical protein
MSVLSIMYELSVALQEETIDNSDNSEENYEENRIERIEELKAKYISIST